MAETLQQHLPKVHPRGAEVSIIDLGEDPQRLPPSLQGNLHTKLTQLIKNEDYHRSRMDKLQQVGSLEQGHGPKFLYKRPNCPQQETILL